MRHGCCSFLVHGFCLVSDNFGLIGSFWLIMVLVYGFLCFGSLAFWVLVDYSSGSGLWLFVFWEFSFLGFDWLWFWFWFMAFCVLGLIFIYVLVDYGSGSSSGLCYRFVCFIIQIEKSKIENDCCLEWGFNYLFSYLIL